MGRWNRRRPTIDEPPSTGSTSSQTPWTGGWGRQCVGCRRKYGPGRSLKSPAGDGHGILHRVLRRVGPGPSRVSPIGPFAGGDTPGCSVGSFGSRRFLGGRRDADSYGGRSRVSGTQSGRLGLYGWRGGERGNSINTVGRRRDLGWDQECPFTPRWTKLKLENYNPLHREDLTVRCNSKVIILDGLPSKVLIYSFVF